MTTDRLDGPAIDVDYDQRSTKGRSEDRLDGPAKPDPKPSPAKKPKKGKGK